MAIDKYIVQKALDENDLDIKAASESLGVQYQLVNYYCRRYKLKYHNKKKPLNVDDVGRLYKELGSLSAVAKKLGATKEGVRLVMKRHNIEINKPVKHSVDDDFFSSDNELSLYWAGFLAADGNVKSNRAELSLALSIKDKTHVQRFIDDVKWTGSVKTYMVKNSERNPEWNDKEKAEVKITSAKMVQDLADRFGIGPRKSKTYKFPKRIVNHPNVHHFMRGYFDGDGSFYTPKTKKPTKQVYCSIRGTVGFLTECRKILEEQCGLPARTRSIRINNGIGVLEYGGNGVCGKIRNFFDKDASLMLDRKRIPFNNKLA